MKFFYCKTDTASETVYWIYAKIIQNGFNHFQIESGRNFNKVSWWRFRYYSSSLFTHFRFKRIRQKLRHLQNQNQLEVSNFSKEQLKMHIIEALQASIRVIKQLFFKTYKLLAVKNKKKVMFLFFTTRMNGRCNFSFWLESITNFIKVSIAYLINLLNTFFKSLELNALSLSLDTFFYL
jgi:hypothetical protein